MRVDGAPASSSRRRGVTVLPAALIAVLAVRPALRLAHRHVGGVGRSTDARIGR